VNIPINQSESAPLVDGHSDWMAYLLKAPHHDRVAIFMYVRFSFVHVCVENDFEIKRQKMSYECSTYQYKRPHFFSKSIRGNSFAEAGWTVVCDQPTRLVRRSLGIDSASNKLPIK
jgi:hypothetical protein